MEGEVSGIAKLGIVLIALAVLIGLGFGIFQISKGTANTGVNNVQSELDGVASSVYTTYDQTTITGQMVRSAVSDFEGSNNAVLVATQAWVNFLKDTYPTATGTANITSGITDQKLMEKGSGFDKYGCKSGTGGASTCLVPVVWAFSGEAHNGSNYTAAPYTMQPSTGSNPVAGSFINYNALLGAPAGNVGTMGIQKYSGSNNTGEKVNVMAGIYYDTNCFRCVTGFMTNASGRVLFNNIVGNLQKSGTTEFIPTGAKFECFLVKDASGTVLGITCQQINQG